MKAGNAHTYILLCLFASVWALYSKSEEANGPGNSSSDTLLGIMMVTCQHAWRDFGHFLFHQIMEHLRERAVSQRGLRAMTHQLLTPTIVYRIHSIAPV